MKKLYTLSLAVILALGASAQGLTVNTAKLQHSNLQLENSASLQQLDNNVIGAQVQQIAIESMKKKSVDSAQTKVVGRATSYQDLLGDWEVTYTNLLNPGGTVTCDATFDWDDEWDQFEISISSNTTGLSFYADYEEATGTLTFNLEVLRWVNQASSLAAAQYPLQGTSGVSKATATYDASANTITFASGYGLSLAQVTFNQSTGQVSAPAGYYWAGTNFQFEKPDGDYKVQVLLSSEHNVANEFTYSVTTGTDIAEAYVIEMDGDVDASMAVSQLGAATIKNLGTKVTAATTYQLKPAAQKTRSGYYTVMLFGFDSAGAIKKSTQAAVYINLPEAHYKTIGKLDYTDNVVTQYYNNFSHTASVDLQESTITPGLFRLVNAYKGQARFDNDGCEHYIYLDITDPEFVNIEESSTGLDFGDGLLVMGTVGGALGYSKEQCQQNGYAVGTLSGRTINFPLKSILVHEQLYNEPGSWTYANSKSETVITLPDLVLKVTVKDNSTSSPVSGATVTVEGVSETTGADGVATLTLPATVDYLQQVSGKVSHNGAETQFSSQLGGVENTQEVNITTTGINDIAADNAEADAVYYNLQGVRVLNPAPGQLVIKQQGNTIVKTIAK